MNQKKPRHRSRLVMRTLDAIVRAPVMPHQSFRANLRTLFKPSTRNYTRLSTLIRIFDTIVPGTALRLSSGIYDYSQLPFKIDHFEIIDYGNGASVYLVNSKFVLKAHNKSFTCDINQLLTLAQHYQHNYHVLKAWYGDIVAPSMFLVVNGPVLGNPYVVTVQPYVSEKYIDPVNDLSDKELLDILSSNQQLAQQFLEFSKKTIETYNRDAQYFDFIGRNNLIIVAGSYLYIIDNGLFDLKSLRQAQPEKYHLISEQKARLEALVTELTHQMAG